MIVEITPIALKNIKYKIYVIFAVFNFLIAVAVYLTFPETKQKSLEQIDFYFAEKFHGESKGKNVAELNRLEEGPETAKTAIDKPSSDTEHIESAPKP